MSWIQKLQNLKMLYEEGSLSAEEFESAKQKLLQSQQEPTMVGDYILHNKIGVGGMGEVFIGSRQRTNPNQEQNDFVAIKILHPQLAQHQEYQKRLKQEALLGQQLNHHGLVRVLDFIETNDQLAIVMEWVRGSSLYETIDLKTGPITFEKAWPLFKQILSAVGHAHDQNIIHRDLKPENIMLSTTGEIKILDFGIAKDLSIRRTNTQAIGTIDYMAPEQYTNNQKIDQRTDIYALGMTFYEMVAGRLPWETNKESDYQILQRKMQQNIPPPTVFYPSIPSFVVAAIDKCLQANIADRFSSVKELQDALDPQTQATTSHKPTAKKYRKIEVSNKNITIKKYRSLQQQILPVALVLGTLIAPLSIATKGVVFVLLAAWQWHITQTNHQKILFINSEGVHFLKARTPLFTNIHTYTFSNKVKLCCVFWQHFDSASFAKEAEKKIINITVNGKRIAHLDFTPLSHDECFYMMEWLQNT